MDQTRAAPSPSCQRSFRNSIGVRGKGKGNGGCCTRGALERVGKTTRVYIHMHKFYAQLNGDVPVYVCVCVNAK